MIILIDTREQQYFHITKKLDSLNIPYKRQTLKFGDYSFELDGKSYENEVVIERKGSIGELVGNFTKGRKRFENEFKRAKGCKLILMIEGSEDDIERHNYMSSMTPSEVKSRIKTWSYFFGFQVEFVEKFDACDFILGEFNKYIQRIKVR
jgi:ERCC4-type nuclease